MTEEDDREGVCDVISRATVSPEVGQVLGQIICISNHRNGQIGEATIRDGVKA